MLAKLSQSQAPKGMMNGWLSQLRWYLQSAQDCVTHKNVPIVRVLLLICRLHKGQVENKDSRHDSKTMYLFLDQEVHCIQHI